LEIDQDLAFQHRSWIVQRIGWSVLALMLVAALLGLFGSGPLGRATAGSEGSSLWIEYERFWRQEKPMTLGIHFAPEAVRDGEVRVWLSRAYLEANAVEQVTPPPDRVETGDDRHTYIFTVGTLEQPSAVRFRLSPDTFGVIDGEAGLDNAPELRFAQLVFP
jgi:hypothetical protein